MRYNESSRWGTSDRLKHTRKSARHAGTSDYWDIGKYGCPARRIAETRKTREFIREAMERAEARDRDRDRREREQGLNWNLIRALLDGNKGMTLQQAKDAAARLEELAIA